MTDTRDLFERTFALCDRQKWQHRDGSYKNTDVQKQWEGWQKALETVPSDADVALELAHRWQKRALEAEAKIARMSTCDADTAQLAAPAPTAPEGYVSIIAMPAD